MLLAKKSFSGQISNFEDIQSHTLEDAAKSSHYLGLKD